MNEALRKELTERFLNEQERPDTEAFKKIDRACDQQVEKVKEAHRADLDFEQELEELNSKIWARHIEYATDAFVFGYEYCLTMLGLGHMER